MMFRNINTTVFIPGKYYPSLSVSGRRCLLNCPYCLGKYLRDMLDVSNPVRLREVMDAYYSSGARGFLISGGFNREGYLLVRSEHLKVIREFKRDHDVIVSMHLGLAPQSLVEEVWESGIDFIDFEIPPSSKYIAYMKNLPDVRLEEFFKLYGLYESLARDFAVPHLVLDSVTSTSHEELEVMERIRMFNPHLFVALIEIRDNPPNDFSRVYKALKTARRYFREVSLGCMRSPIFKKKYDRYIVSEGLVDRIAVPEPSLIKEGLPVVWACCSVPRDKWNLFPSGFPRLNILGSEEPQ